MGCGASAIARPPTTISERPPVRPIYRQALGRIARLGDLYDATTDNFCKKSVFGQPLPPDSPAISKTDNPYNDSRRYEVSTLEEKCRQLKVTGELQLSILAGMCEQIQGSAEYLTQKKNSFGTVTRIQISYIKTVTERLEVSHDHVKNYILKEAIHHPRATHVVVEIEWGANCVITTMERKYKVEKKQEAEGVLGWIGSGLVKAGNYLSGNTNEAETEERTETSVEILGDVLPDELPQTSAAAQDMMQSIPQLVQNCNDGKGKPLTYVMIPIGHLDWKKRSQQVTFISIDDARAMNVVRLFDRMTELRDGVKKRNEVEARLEGHEAKVKVELYQLLENVRSGKAAIECLDDFSDKHRKIAEEISRQ